MHILHCKKIEQHIEKLSESFLDLSLNWAAVGELKNGEWNGWTDISWFLFDFKLSIKQ